MSKSSIKPKVLAIWSEQTEKLKKKLTDFMDTDLNFEPGKLDEILSRVQDKSGKNNQGIFEINKI